MIGLAFAGLVEGSFAAVVIAPTDASRHVGEAVTVEGLAEAVICSPRACLISFGAGWSGLVATIADEDLTGFPPPKETYEGHRVQVRGVVQERDGRLRVEITDASRIEVLPEDDRTRDAGGGRSHIVSTRSDGAPAAAPQASASSGGTTRVEVSGGVPSSGESRVSDIVRELQAESGESAATGAPQAAVSGLRDRVAKQSQTIASLEGEVASLEERLAEMEREPEPAPTESALPGVPRLEPYVVPARSRLRDPHVRTGWSIDRLVREIGPPRTVEPMPGGGAVWYYDGGRAVTVGDRGRVVSATGF